MASVEEFGSLQTPTSHAPISSLPLRCATPSVFIYNGACDEMRQWHRPALFDPPPSSTQLARSAFLPNLSPVAAPDFAAPPSDSVLGQSSRCHSWPSLGKSADILSQPLFPFPAQAPLSRGIAEITRSPPDRKGVHGCHSAMKEDSRALTRESVQKQRVLNECLRRKRMSKWFSKLELLLPQEDITKFDRCSVIDAAIKYIHSLEKTIAEASQSSDPQNLERSNISTIQGKPNCPITRSPSPVVEQHGAQRSVVAVSAHSEDAFVNAVSCQRDPTLFSSVLSVLQEHSLEILTASLSRSEESVCYSAHAKIPNAGNLCSQHLKTQIYNRITRSPQELSPEMKELAQL